MKKYRRLSLLALVVVFLTLGAGMRGASAYFTTYVTVEGGHPVFLDIDTDIDEKVSDWTKRLSVSCDVDSEPVYVRARAYCGSFLTLEYSDPEGKWTENSDGYYYYDLILGPGERTSELDVTVSDIPEDVTEGDGFHVIVIYETTPVLYRDDGTPYADWSRILYVGSTEGGSRP